RPNPSPSPWPVRRSRRHSCPPQRCHLRSHSRCPPEPPTNSLAPRQMGQPPCCTHHWLRSNVRLQSTNRLAPTHQSQAPHFRIPPHSPASPVRSSRNR